MALLALTTVVADRPRGDDLHAGVPLVAFRIVAPDPVSGTGSTRSTGVRRLARLAGAS